MITCPNGLVYNDKAGICSWPDEAKKSGCSSQGNVTLKTLFASQPEQKQKRNNRTIQYVRSGSAKACVAQDGVVKKVKT